MQILFNAYVYTGFKDAPIVTALLLHDDRILAAGSDDEIFAAAPSGTPRQDMQGKTLLPGLTDSHMHLKHFSLGLQSVNGETDTIEECLRRVEEKAQATPAGDWVQGWGWNHNVWNGQYGTAAQLDRAAPDHPVILSAKSGHAAWANSRALQIAGIDAATPDPEGGLIQKDANGKPTGILFETAEQLVTKHVPAPTQAVLKDAVMGAQEHLWRLGVTALHDFDTPDLFAALQELDRERGLNLRVVKGIPVDILDHAIESGLHTGFGSDHLRIGSVKVFMDGALGPQTAAMLEPYENSTQKGILALTAAEVYEIGQKASAHGLSLAIHAIGDLANREVLDAYEKLRKYEQEQHLRPLRHRIEHVQLLHPQEYARLAKLNIIGSVQPLHATSDMVMADKFWGSRAAGAYAFNTLLRQGTQVTFGSDAPVEVPDPFAGLHAAVTRRRKDGTPGEQGWNPEQRISLSEALYAYTAAPAYAAGMEDYAGRLTAGYYADLIVLDRDPFSLPVQELYQLRPSATMVGGKWVWQGE